MASDYVMDDLEVLEVSETDAALLRDLLEELENEETMNKNDDNNVSNCLVQTAADDKNNSKSNVFEVEEQAFVERNDFCVYDSSWVETTMESTGCSLVQADDMAVSDWYANDGAVEVVEFECCNGSIGDYSYLSNEMTYSCLWEQDN